MLVIPGINSAGNVLHVVAGEETEFMLDLHGSAVTDITPVLNAMPSDKKVLLHFTRCASEDVLADQLTSVIASGGSYPFYPGTHTFVPGGKQAVRPPVKRSSKGAKGEPAKATQCSRCGARGCELVPNLKPAICYPCVKLDMALADSRRKKGMDDESPRHNK